MTNQCHFLEDVAGYPEDGGKYFCLLTGQPCVARELHDRVSDSYTVASLSQGNLSLCPMRNLSKELGRKVAEELVQIQISFLQDKVKSQSEHIRERLDRIN